MLESTPYCTGCIFHNLSYAKARETSPPTPSSRGARGRGAGGRWSAGARLPSLGKTAGLCGVFFRCGFFLARRLRQCERNRFIRISRQTRRRARAKTPRPAEDLGDYCNYLYLLCVYSFFGAGVSLIVCSIGSYLGVKMLAR